MTLKASFFNKGIYLSTLKRYLWGAVVYFLALFVSTSLAILLVVDKTSTTQYRYLEGSLLFNGDFSVFPTLFLICVPTFAAVLIFRFIHSKKTSVFTHSLPTTRTANYISSTLAGFTLMAVPVILNGIILMIISMCGYGRFFDVTSCFEWIGINLYALFILFSCAVFCASITGNSFAMIGLNVLIHGFVPLMAAGFSVVADKFLYGYSESNAIINSVIEYNFVGDVASSLLNYSYKIPKAGEIIFNLITAIVIYALAYVLYKKRRLENAEDVAAYKCLNPIYKYLVTFLTALAAFSIFSTFVDERPLTLIIIVAIICAVIYFACEMILKKTLRVWPAYKGYIGFAIFCAAITVFTAQTTFFGYETRIPKKEDITSAAVYNYYYDEKEPFTADAQIIESALLTHKELVKKENITILEPSLNKPNDMTRIHIKYTLNNGKIFYRVYTVTREKCYELMNVFYANEAYKKQCENIFRIENNVINAGIKGMNPQKEQLPSLVDAMKKDILSLSFEQIYNNDINCGFSIYIDYETGRDKNNNILTDHFYKTINKNYVNTISWLKENGYWEELMRKVEEEKQNAKNYKDEFASIDADAIDEITSAEVVSSVY